MGEILLKKGGTIHISRTTVMFQNHMKKEKNQHSGLRLKEVEKMVIC